MDPDETWGNGRGCPLVVHYWAGLQLVHRFRCYDNIVPNSNCQRMLVLALCLVVIVQVCTSVKYAISALCVEKCKFHNVIIQAGMQCL